MGEERVDEELRRRWVDRAAAAWDTAQDGVSLPSGVRGRRLEAWLDGQLERTADELWATRFQRSCPVPGQGPEAYLHRVLPGRGRGEASLLAGIRFKGGRGGAPFVDLLAWDEELRDGPGHAAVAARLRKEFEAFGPRYVRLCSPGAAGPPGVPAEDREVDQWLLAERLSVLRTRVHPWGWGSLDVRPAVDLGWYEDFVAQFELWKEGVGPRASEVTPASEAELRPCLEEGTLLVAWMGGRFGGLVAARRVPLPVMDGYGVQEFFLGSGLRGQRRSAILQRHLVDHLLDHGRDVLHGTIHRTNRPSLRAAQRTGRKIVETWWFLRL